MSTDPSQPAAVINPFYPKSKDADLANRASDDALAAALHGVDVNGPHGPTVKNANSGSASHHSSSNRSRSAAAANNNDDDDTTTDPLHYHRPLTQEEQSYPVAWQLTAVREELAETRNISSRLRRQIGARDADCALLEARIVDAGNQRKNLETQITEQLKRRSKVGHLTTTTEQQKKKLVHQNRTTSKNRSGSSSSRTTTSLGRPLSGRGRDNADGENNSTSSSRDFEYTTSSRDDEKRVELEEEIHAREIADLRYRHRMFREEIIKWQKKRRILENSSLKMSTQADDEKFFNADNAKQRKAERKLLHDAERIKSIQKGERDHLETQNRDISKQLGNLRFKVRDAEEDLAAKRRQMNKLRDEAEKVRAGVVQARQDTAQSVVQAQEALARVRFEEDKALKESQKKQREAAQRELANVMSPLGVVAAATNEEYEQTNKPEESKNQNDDDKNDETGEKTTEKANANTNNKLTQDQKRTLPNGASPPRKLPPQAPPQSQQQAISASPFAQHQQQLQPRQVQVHQNPQPQNYQQFLQNFRESGNNNQNNTNNAATSNRSPTTTQPRVVASDQSHNYQMYDRSADDPRDAWFTLAPRDGASTNELFDELTRIVRTVGVEFGKPALRLLDGVPEGEDL